MTATRFGLRSLPTYYKGITFRSRLEARWAIILDEMGIDWEYEVEAYKIERTHFCDEFPKEFNYLPDFYLPKYGAFLEIKGALGLEEYWKILKIAHAFTRDSRPVHGLSIPFWVGGNIGQDGQVPMPINLWNYKGWIYGSTDQLDFENPFDQSTMWDIFGDDTGGLPLSEDIDFYLHILCNNFGVNRSSTPLEKAVNKARKVRFEDGRHV